MAAEEKLRADAERNRQRIVAAARQVYAAQGLDVSMRQIARHAGVGEPTLRRRFASRNDLVAEVFCDQVAAYADAAEAALAGPDPWQSFCSFIGQVARMQLADRGLTEVLTKTFPPEMGLEHERRRAYKAFQRLIVRAQRAGRLRADFVPEDLVLLLMAHAGVVAAAGESAGRFSPRLLAYFLQAFAAPGGGELPPSPSASETYRMLLRLHG